MKVEDVSKLKGYLMEFRDKTIELIAILESDNYDSLEETLNVREKVIEAINLITYDNKVFKELCLSLKILPLQQKLQLIMNQKKSILQEDINRISSNASANKSYNKAFSVDSLYLSKKI